MAENDIGEAKNYLSSSDIVKAVTNNIYGQGHSDRYFSKINHREMEILANTGQIYFELINKGTGNKFINKHFPKLNEIIKEYWNEELQ